MLDQLFELSRKATESTFEMQQAMLKYFRQDWSSTPAAAGISADWGGTIRKHWVDLTIETLNKQREALDSTFRQIIRTIENTSGVSGAKSAADESTRAAENVWRGLYDTFKKHSDAQFREFRSWAEKSFSQTSPPSGTDEHATRQ